MPVLCLPGTAFAAAACPLSVVTAVRLCCAQPMVTPTPCPWQCKQRSGCLHARVCSCQSVRTCHDVSRRSHKISPDCLPHPVLGNAGSEARHFAFVCTVIPTCMDEGKTFTEEPCSLSRTRQEPNIFKKRAHSNLKGMNKSCSHGDTVGYRPRH